MEDEECEHDWEVERNHSPDGSYWWNETVCINCDAVREFDDE